LEVSGFIDHLTRLSDYEGQIAYTQYIPAQDANLGALEKPLNPLLQSRLESQGIASLFSHQAKAINAARNGKHVMVATASASGKSMCYNIPVLEALLGSSDGRALYLFPTKALAQDQLRSIRELACPRLLSPSEFATFDGDTPQDERGGIKKQARLILTNPDMLHLGILPNHKTWSRLLTHLKFVVIDEAHTYRGVFGSHVAQVLRRLRRVCRQYGSSPQFICCSATIANPREHAEKLVGQPFEVVTEDGAPHGKKSFIFWNPPIIDKVKTTRRSANSEATFLFTELIRNNIRTMVFARTRKLTELIYMYTRDHLVPSLADRVKPYRAGYLAEERRKIERELFNGNLLGVVATNALELGIDIGDLEATVLTGYPGSIASTWQQAGRSGRSSDSSLSILIGLDNPLDQYFMKNPDFFFGKPFENALINLENLNILKPHVLCAAWEQPLHSRDAELFGAAFSGAVAELEAEGKLRKTRGMWYLAPSIAHPAGEINIRSAMGASFAVLDASRGYDVLEIVESSIAFFQLHPGAVYLHQGEPYFIETLDLAKRVAIAKPAAVPYYTQAKDLTDIKVLKVIKERYCNGVNVCFGQVEVTTTVIGYRKKMQFTEEVIGDEMLDLPPQQFITEAVWFDLPQKAIDSIAAGRLDFAGALHAAEHACIALLPLFALCDRNDIGGVSTPFHADTGKAGIFIYDAYPGGVGIAEKGFEVIEELWSATLKAIENCPCQEGCPSCVQSPKCGNNNEPLNKMGAMVLLRNMEN
jgi:DEAD/DEAH box helicase domain-containing protein